MRAIPPLPQGVVAVLSPDGLRSLGLPLLVRIDARRPASWIALAAAGIGGWAAATGRGEGGPLAAAWMTGGLAAVAAIGDLPLPLCDAGIAAGRGRLAAWTCLRAAWPAAGLIAGAALARGLDTAPVVVAGLGAAAAAAAGILGCRLLAASAADAASLALAGCLASAAVISGLVGRCSAIPSLAAGGIGWAAIVLAVLAWCVGRRTPLSPGGGARADGVRSGILPAQGPLRRTLVRASMISALAAMVAWLSLDPGRAGLYPPLAFGWFVALAVPRAALLDGVNASAAWRRLFRSAAGGPSGRLPLESLRRPGPARAAAESTLSCAAILGWPPLVVGALEAGEPARGWPCLAVSLALAAVALLVTAAAAVTEAAGASGETLQAVLLTAAVLLVADGVVAAAGRRLVPAAVAVPSPSPPVLPNRHSRRPADQPDVEQTVGSCQTARSMQTRPAPAGAGRACFLNGLRRECVVAGTIEKVQVVTAVTAPPFFEGVFSCTDK